MMCIVCLFCVAAVIAAPAQNVSFITLASFNGADGLSPQSTLIQTADGNFYGTTRFGGNYSSNCEHGCGTVFKITPAGTLTRLYSFCSQANCSDGAFPASGLVQARDGNLYGTTLDGGSSSCLDGCGTVYRITPEGAFTTLHSFDVTDGDLPYAGLVQGADGNFYGTTSGSYAGGTVFKITPSGELTTLHYFEGSDGSEPVGSLVQATDGNFYGTTYVGGAYGECLGLYGDSTCGTVFKITPAGALTTMYSFCSQWGWGCPDGQQPWGGLVQASDGNFYGTTQYGGTNDGCGTIFKITPAGTLTTLYSFDGTDGCQLEAGLVQASDGNFYGTTFAGGHAYGTVFQITPAGALTTLYSFCSLPNCTDGAHLGAGLVQAANGFFYGTAESGGADDDGTVFRVGLPHTCATCRP
jgi:uncharacterized repeat protein (TIGR03803 family)